MPTKKTLLEYLKEARDTIADIDNWTYIRYARDAKGNEVTHSDTQAVKWCAVGAMYKATSWIGNLRTRLRTRIDIRYALDTQAIRLFGVEILELNDQKKYTPRIRHQNVLRVYEAAIAKEEKEPTNAN